MKPLAFSPAISENETVRRGVASTASGPNQSEPVQEVRHMADGSYYYDSSGESKPANTHPILTAADLARCEAISPRRKTPMAEIARAVSEQTGIPTADIYGRKRTAPIAQARQLVMYLCRREGMKLEAIGSYLGRDHTTILDGIKAEKARRGEL